MKNLTILIIVLAGTIFGACGKKSSNNGGTTQYPAGYVANGYYGQPGGYYQQDAGYYGQNQQVMFNTNLGCGDQAPQYINNLVDYCVWLAEDARYNCDIRAVKTEFMARCMHMAQSYNFCVPTSGVGRSFYYTSSSSYSGSDYSDDVEETPIRHETYRPAASSAQTPVAVVTKPATTQAAQVAPTETAQTQTPAAQPKLVENQLVMTEASSTPVAAPIDFNKCLNLEIIHKAIINPKFALASFSRQYIVTNVGGLTDADRNNITSAIYGLPLNNNAFLGSHRMSATIVDGKKESAIGGTVIQKSDSLNINGAIGNITYCDSDSNYMEVVFDNKEKNAKYIYKFQRLTEDEISFETETTSVAVGNRTQTIKSLTHVIWKNFSSVDSITKRDLQMDLADLSKELLRDKGHDVDGYLKNTLSIITKNSYSNEYSRTKDKAEEARGKQRDAEFRRACEAAADMCKASK